MAGLAFLQTTETTLGKPMIRSLLLAAAMLAFAPIGVAQTPGGQTVQPPFPDEAATLGWMQGVRMHTNADGSQVLEAFLGPVNGVVTGTALSAIGTEKAYTEYHRIGPNAEGVYGLDVANTRGGMKWNFTPLKAIEPDRITFESADGKLTISYASDGAGGINAQVDRVGADNKATSQMWAFKPTEVAPVVLPAPAP
jgi:hypothetical protein